MGEVRGREKQLKREQLVQIKSGDWCVSFTLQLPICFKVFFVPCVLGKLIVSCDVEQISEIPSNKISDFIQRTCSHLLMVAKAKTATSTSLL